MVEEYWNDPIGIELSNIWYALMLEILDRLPTLEHFGQRLHS